MRLHFLFILLLSFLFVCNSVNIKWVADSFHLTSTLLDHSHAQVNLTANGPVANDDRGNVQLQFTIYQAPGLHLTGKSTCLSPNAPASQWKASLTRVALNYVGSYTHNNTQLGNLFTLAVVRYYHINSAGNGVHIAYSIRLSNTSSSTPSHYLSSLVTATSTDCAPLRTEGYWSDSVRWSGGVAPSASDDVTIPHGAGKIIITTDVTVRSLTQAGGQLVLQESSCPLTWTVDDRFTDSQKCYKLIDTPMTFAQATSFCRYEVAEGSSFDRQVVHIGDRQEADLVYRMCRRSPFANLSDSSALQSDVAGSGGCWLGLSDPLGFGQFSWQDARAIGRAKQKATYYDWAKGEPNNLTVSSGEPNQGGERCVAVMPWTDNPLLQEEGGWNDVGCQLRKAFVCQMFAQNSRHTLNIAQKAVFYGSAAIYGGILSVAGTANLTHLFARSTNLTFLNQSSVVITTSFTLQDNAQANFFGTVEVRPNSVVGEVANDFLGFSLNTASAADLGAQPVTTFWESSRVLLGCYSGSCGSNTNANNHPISFQTRVNGRGRIIVLPHVIANLQQGGDMSLATVSTAASDSLLSIGGYASRLSAYDSFILSLSSISSVVNVVWPWKGKKPNSALGVYKIAISDVRGLKQITQCLPYNLSATQMASALNSLPLIAARGGVTVRRYGNQSDVTSSYGFTYRIEVDAVSTALFAAGRLTAAIQCYGMQCGDCYETEVAFEPAYAPYCQTGANFSTTNPNTCVMTPSLSVTALSVQSYCNYTGKGTLELTSSRHRLPPITTSTIAVSSGIGVVAADVVQWSKFQGVSEGILVVAGAGWEGWQSSSLLYAPSWTLDRGLVSVLLQAPTCAISITTFTVQDNAAVLTSAPSSNFSVQSLRWAGGVIGGLGTTAVQSSLVMSGASKFLSYGMHLVLAASASADWGQGNFYLGNGANVTVLGDWRISNYGAKITVYQAPQSAEAVLLNPFEDTQGRSWGSYYSDALTSELRPGWYLNPLCGDYCLTSSQMTFGGKGNLSTSTSANVSFYLPLNMIDESTIKVGDYADVSLHNGGTLGNEVVVDLSPGAVIHLTGGSLNMEARSTITGAGDLVVVAGAHNLAFSINAHITISNGSLIWPTSRGPSQTITFYGGLMINGTGSLQVEPYATTIVIHKEVYLKDQAVIQFPLIGIAPQPSPYDELDAPDTFPRGNMTSLNSFIWEGGELTGNVDIYALTQLILDGDQKNISSVAKLINRGHCEWGTGDVIASNNGDFINYGTMQVRVTAGSSFTANMVYKGSDVPVANGGDPFALDYHTWDMDNGALDYSQYISLRTEFVSRVPNGWNSSDQHQSHIFNN